MESTDEQKAKPFRLSRPADTDESQATKFPQNWELALAFAKEARDELYDASMTFGDLVDLFRTLLDRC